MWGRCGSANATGSSMQCCFLIWDIGIKKERCMLGCGVSLCFTSTLDQHSYNQLCSVQITCSVPVPVRLLTRPLVWQSLDTAAVKIGIIIPLSLIPVVGFCFEKSPRVRDSCWTNKQQDTTGNVDPLHLTQMLYGKSLFTTRAVNL